MLLVLCLPHLKNLAGYLAGSPFLPRRLPHAEALTLRHTPPIPWSTVTKARHPTLLSALDALVQIADYSSL